MISMLPSDSLLAALFGPDTSEVNEMRGIRIFVCASLLAIASLGGASGVSARTPVDPTTLTPPLQPFRLCYEQGPWVNCDTSGVST